MEYPVTLEEKTVGSARLTRQGLYYRVECRCDLPGEGMCRLEAAVGEKRVDLGILVPMEHGFGLQTSFPVSRVGEGTMAFRIQRKRQTEQGRQFVPIIPEEPFSYQDRLKEAYLDIQDWKRGANIPQPQKERFSH